MTSWYVSFKSEKARYYQDLEKSQQKNLALRKSLIEELKGLIGVDRPISDTYKQFKDLQARWRESGHVPQSEANNIWKTYHHHVGIFYDFLHLNREFRELDYKYNYEEKIKIIEEVEEMAKMDNIQKAFRICKNFTNDGKMSLALSQKSTKKHYGNDLVKLRK